MVAGGPEEGAGREPDRPYYSSNRKRSGSRVRSVAVLCALFGCAVVVFALANLYVPEATGPVGIDPTPIISLSAIGSAGGALVLFSALVYLFAHRAGV